MIFKFRVISSEVGDFVRDIEIRPEHSFYDLHKVLTDNLHYDGTQLASFFTSNKEWEKDLEITLFDLSEGSSPNIRIMDKTLVEEFINQKRDRLLYVFDYFNERVLFIELVEIIKVDPEADYPRISYSMGSPPPQILILDTNFDDLETDDE